MSIIMDIMRGSMFGYQRFFLWIPAAKDRYNQVRYVGIFLSEIFGKIFEDAEK